MAYNSSLPELEIITAEELAER